MNEVGATVGAAEYVVKPASLPGAGPTSTQNGNALPDKPVEELADAQKPKAEPYPNGIRSAVVEVNNFVQSIQRDLQFNLDTDLEKTIIKVIDSNSGDVIRQIPEDIFLELARRLNQDQEVNLLDELG